MEFTPFPNESINTDVSVVDVSLVLIHFHVKPSIIDLGELSNKVIEYLRINAAILYLYFDHNNDIATRDREITPQEYRGILFGCLIERYSSEEFVSKKLRVKDNELVHVITLICHEDEEEKMKQLQDEVRRQGDK